METRTWTLQEAREALPLVKRITSEAHQRFTELYQHLEDTILPEGELEEREEDLKAILAGWAAEIQNLGADVKGLWLVDFDHGSGYYCWKFGEDQLLFEHTYDAGFAGRHPIIEEDS